MIGVNICLGDMKGIYPAKYLFHLSRTGGGNHCEEPADTGSARKCPLK